MKSRKKSKKEIVELRPAVEWTCPECGRDQFERSYTPELEPGDIVDVPDEVRDFSIDDDCAELTGGVFVFVPGIVQCDFCGEEYEAEAQSHWKA
jgi:transcription elongation factor Elf1